MSLIVTRPFTTHIQRFAAGAPVTPQDHLAPFGFDDLRSRGWIADENVASPPAAPEERSEIPEQPVTHSDTPGRSRRGS